ncbi:TPA: fimbrial protein [Raoultella planticola]
MKNIAPAVVVMTTLGLISASSFAASTGTITFNGELTDTTCNVDVNGQGSDATVTLPTVSISELTTDKQVTGRTSFNMNLTDCVIGTTNGKSKVSAFFQPGSTVDLSTGRLNNVGGSATNVQLQLLDATGSFNVINVGNTDQVSSTEYVDIASDGTATLPYAVEYYALGQTTAGTVTSSVVYNLQYN